MVQSKLKYSGERGLQIASSLSMRHTSPDICYTQGHDKVDILCYFLFVAIDPSGSGPPPPSFTRFLEHIQRRTTVGKTTPDE